MSNESCVAGSLWVELWIAKVWPGAQPLWNFLSWWLKLSDKWHNEAKCTNQSQGSHFVWYTLSHDHSEEEEKIDGNTNSSSYYRVIKSNCNKWFFSSDSKNSKNGITQSFLESWCAAVLVFWCLSVVRWNNVVPLGLCQNGVLAPYCREWEPRYRPTHPSASDFHEYHLDTPRHPQDTPQTPPGNTTCK